MNERTFGEMLRELRMREGYSQESLAERAQISSAAVAAIEQGLRRAPYRETVAALAEALNLDVADRARLESAAGRARRRAPTRRDPRISKHNLPVYLTSFIDRDELYELSVALRSHRLVTVTGMGGIGKTRIVVELLERSLADGPREIAFVDLSSIHDGSLIAPEIATLLQISVDEGGDVIEAITAALTTKDVTIVIDNCEHLVAATAGVVEKLLKSGSGTRVIATSRELLRLSSEVVFRLSSLDKGRAALALFVDRAKAVDRFFVVDSTNERSLTELCRALDGIPLAIELAAARVLSLGIDEMRSRINEALRGVAREDRPERQRTLAATIAWSYSLLNDAEQMVFSRLSVFAGSFDIEAAESVCADDLVPSSSVADVVASLMTKSLINSAQVGDVIRFSMLESLRRYGANLIEERGEATELRARHGEWLAEMADELHRLSRSRGFPELAYLEADNVRAAQQWACDATLESAWVAGARILIGFRYLWMRPGWRRDFISKVDRALSRIDEHRHLRVVALLMLAKTNVLDGLELIEVSIRAIELGERAGELEFVAMLLSMVAMAQAQRGAFVQSHVALSRVEQYFLAYPPSEPRAYARFLTFRAYILCQEGEVAAARRDIVEVGRLAKTGVVPIEDGRLVVAAEIEFAAGDTKRAVELSRAALDAVAGQTVGRLNALIALASYEAVIGNLGEAKDSIQSLMDDDELVSVGSYACEATQVCALIEAVTGNFETAAKLSASVDRAYYESGLVRGSTERRVYNEVQILLAKTLSADQRDRLAIEGWNLPFEQAWAEGRQIASLWS